MNKTLFAVVFACTLVSILAVECPKDTEGSEATYFPHETECGKFYECDNGTPKEFSCPPGEYWDVRVNICNVNVDCGDLLTSTSPPQTTDASDFD